MWQICEESVLMGRGVEKGVGAGAGSTSVMEAPYHCEGSSRCWCESVEKCESKCGEVDPLCKCTSANPFLGLSLCLIIKIFLYPVIYSQAFLLVVHRSSMSCTSVSIVSSSPQTNISLYSMLSEPCKAPPVGEHVPVVSQQHAVHPCQHHVITPSKVHLSV